jgi:hypothetical protein
MDDDPARERILFAAVVAPRSEGAARLLSTALSCRHAVGRHSEPASMDRKIDLIVTTSASGSWRH